MTDTPPTEPTPPKEAGFADRTFEGGAPAMFGCLAIAALLLCVLIFGISRCSSSDEPQATAANEATAAEPDKPNEIGIVSECDMFVKAGLTSESSYNPSYSWTFMEKPGGIAEVRRKFEAQNAFGANITSVYECQYNTTARQLVYLMIRGPMGRQVLIDMRPSKKKRRQSD